MELHSAKQVRQYFVNSSLFKHTEDVTVQRLSGGVSCIVWKVTAGDERWVMKQALGKLAVEVDWFSDVQRIKREQQAMRFLEPMMPEGTIPHIVHTDEDNHLYIMTCAPEQSVPWNNKLMDGEFHPDAAHHAGVLLRTMHENSKRSALMEQQEMFGNLSFFTELRIAPFHHYLLIKYPELTSNMDALIFDLTERRTCLVHGDYSPKNMLVDQQQQVILLDYEVAHWGNPVFDLAFMLTHLLLKGWVLQRQTDALLLMERFLHAYGYKQKSDSRLVGHIGALLLARIDGKSPVGYLKDENLKVRIRQISIEWIWHADIEAKSSLELAMKG